MSNIHCNFTWERGGHIYYCHRVKGHLNSHRDYRWDEGIEQAPQPTKRAEVNPGDWLQSLTSAERKEVAVARGLFAYFPDALALIARHSVRSNEKHNPGQPVHWSREQSNDHEDCIARHSLAVAVDPNSMDGDAPHVACRAWRALAALQLWIEDQRRKGRAI